jgi:CheY-like chemotaxis protein
MEETSVISHKRLLLVDDDPNLILLVADYLEFRGYEVITAESSREALDFLEQDLPHLIISDVLRPEMNGYAFVENIRQNVRTSWIPFLFLSAMIGQSYNRIIGFNLGADACMAKPFEPEELVAQIEALISSLYPTAPSSETSFAQAVRLPYTIVPYIVSDYSGYYPDGTLVVYNTAGGEEVTSAGYAVAIPLPYYFASESDQYPPSTLVVWASRWNQAARAAGFEEAEPLPYYFASESDQYPPSTLVVRVSYSNREARAAGYDDAVPLIPEEMANAEYAKSKPLPYYVASESSQYPPSTLVVRVSYSNYEARAAGYDDAVPLIFRSNNVRVLDMLDTEYAAMLQNAQEQNSA